MRHCLGIDRWLGYLVIFDRIKIIFVGVMTHVAGVQLPFHEDVQKPGIVIWQWESEGSEIIGIAVKGSLFL
jgi:hypothetical protein